MLSLTVSINHLFIQDINKYSHLAALITGIPVVLMGWLEAVSCNYFLVYFGGHFIYDLSIHLSAVVYFLVARDIEIKTNHQKV